MSGFTEAQRVRIRHFLGFGALWLQAYPRLENAITHIQAVADGGDRPDNSSKAAMEVLIADATTVETSLRALWCYAEVAGKQEEATIDPFRGAIMLRAEGRRIVYAMARLLGMVGPIADVFSSGEITPVGEDPFTFGSPTGNVA